MKFRHLALLPLLLAAIPFQGCESIGDKLHESRGPELPPQIYAHATTFTPQYFSPWKPPNPFEYEGKYYGRSGNTSERLEIEIFGDSEGVMITGTRRVETAGQPAVTTTIAPTLFNLEFDPFFQTPGQNGFFVNFIDPSEGLSTEPIPGIVLGPLFFAKEKPRPVE